MQCPKDSLPLEKSEYKGIDVDTCKKCHGMWFDLDELDQLEDQVMDNDELKSSVVLSSSPSDHKCPKCQTNLKSFQYRMEEELILEYCPNNHGWWLDKGEEQKVLELMQKEENDIERIKKAEDKWVKQLWRMKNKNFFTDLLSHIV
ncbi:MAG TPA: zf-TFIIB domain-containing protein [Patescibacteria group bacterium]|nr:zf-TFIIB domain-containing protein [Patescibacteria group bacterium]